jgi:hypothetical protein
MKNNIWKDRLVHILYLHYRPIVILLVAIGGGVASWVVYLFLFTSAPVEYPEEQVVDTPIKQEALSRVVLWVQMKQEKSAADIAVPNDVFAVPSSVQ